MMAEIVGSVPASLFSNTNDSAIMNDLVDTAGARLGRELLELVESIHGTQTFPPKRVYKN